MGKLLAAENCTNELASKGRFDGQGDHHTPKPFVRQEGCKNLECASSPMALPAPTVMTVGAVLIAMGQSTVWVATDANRCSSCACPVGATGARPALVGLRGLPILCC